ncbi:MAG: CCA tRNA nucleotidyltransferase [Rickettsiales bacterium]|jgi:poly(A) polymerase|nr:CCA tRNA nucleotidyltransferase [Rickettsiales bacterium]
MFFDDNLLLIHSIFKDKIRLVGGSVRNFILKQKIVDYDLSCLLSPEEIKNKLIKYNVKYLTIGEKYGTITAVINSKNYEITSARVDVKTDGRRAEVEYIDNFESDSQRRDFTFNSLYMDFKGNIYDYHNGITDIRKGIVRFVGNAEDRIKEDYLRILRFFRFFAYYGFILDNKGFEAVIKLKNNLNKISRERIKDEIFKIFNARYPIKALRIMDKLNILNGDYKNLEFFYSYKPFLLNYNLSTTMALSLFINELPQNIRISNNEKKEIQNYLKIKKLNYLDDIKKKILLFEYKNPDLLMFNCFMHNKNVFETINFIEKTKIPVLPINGNDLKCYEGKTIGSLLNRAKEIFISHNFKISKDELLKEIQKTNQ